MEEGNASEFPFNQVPFVLAWVTYKGQWYWAGINYEKSVACHRPIIDLAHCMTYDQPIKSVNYQPQLFTILE